MALPEHQSVLKFSYLNETLGLPWNAPISLGTGKVRGMFDIPSGAINMDSGHGKSFFRWSDVSPWYWFRNVCWVNQEDVLSVQVLWDYPNNAEIGQGRPPAPYDRYESGGYRYWRSAWYSFSFSNPYLIYTYMVGREPI
jgi:hypothetical protein